MDPIAIVVVAGVIFGYALIARALDRTVLDGPMLFTAAACECGPSPGAADAIPQSRNGHTAGDLVMAHQHRAFVVDMLAKIGTPVFAATLVGCLLKDEVRLMHMVLMGVGLALMYLGHRLEYHRA